MPWKVQKSIFWNMKQTYTKDAGGHAHQVRKHPSTCIT